MRRKERTTRDLHSLLGIPTAQGSPHPVTAEEDRGTSPEQQRRREEEMWAELRWGGNDGRRIKTFE